LSHATSIRVTLDGVNTRPPIVFGWDATPGILACHLDPDGAHVRVYRRVDSQTVVSREPFAPFLLVADPALLQDAPGLTALDRLDGASWRSAGSATRRNGATGSRETTVCASTRRYTRT